MISKFRKVPPFYAAQSRDVILVHKAANHDMGSIHYAAKYSCTLVVKWRNLCRYVPGSAKLVSKGGATFSLTYEELFDLSGYVRYQTISTQEGAGYKLSL